MLYDWMDYLMGGGGGGNNIEQGLSGLDMLDLN